MTDYFFKSGSRSIIIFKLKQFFNTRVYLKTKNNRTDVFDAVFKSSIAEYQQYHRLKIQDGSLNEETYAKIGSELSEVEISMLAFHHPLLKKLLVGTTADTSTVTSGDNPNCIRKVLPNGIWADRSSAYDMTPLPDGTVFHDGIHIYSISKTPGIYNIPVTALKAMAGTIRWIRTEEEEPPYKPTRIDILLDGKIDGQTFWLILKDIKPSPFAGTKIGERNVKIKGGELLGVVKGESDPPTVAFRGLHITLVSAKNYGQLARNIQAGINSPASILMNAAKDPKSPFKCS